jgi:hypothetical protein
MSSIGFTSNVEISMGILRKSLDEALKEDMEVRSDLGFVNITEYTEGVASTYRLIEVENVSNIIPGVRVDAKSLVIIINLVWAILNEEAKFTGASWSTSKPDNEGILGRSCSRFKKPVEKGTLGTDRNETRVESFIEEDGAGVLFDLGSGFVDEARGQTKDGGNDKEDGAHGD